MTNKGPGKLILADTHISENRPTVKRLEEHCAYPRARGDRSVGRSVGQRSPGRMGVRVDWRFGRGKDATRERTREGTWHPRTDSVADLHVGSRIRRWKIAALSSRFVSARKGIGYSRGWARSI